MSIGNELYRRIGEAKNNFFAQGELAQLTHHAFENAVIEIQNRKLDVDEIEVSYPVGFRSDKQTIPSSHKYKKQDLIDRYQYLDNHQLAINGIYQLVANMEALLGDILRKVILKFPNKLSAKRTIKTGLILAASSIEEIHLQLVDTVLNDLSYKSPKEFAEECENLLSIKLLECPAFHKYIETKATRDIYIHNQGVANEIYTQKSGSHARVKAGDFLPIDIVYFLESYESCLQITEWLELQLNDVWHSSEFEDKKKQDANVSQNSDS